MTDSDWPLGRMRTAYASWRTRRRRWLIPVTELSVLELAVASRASRSRTLRKNSGSPTLRRWRKLVAQSGELDLDAPVARYWPEFAANGKQGIVVHHLLSHSSGVSAWAQPVTIDDVYDREKATAMLASQEPWWGHERGRAFARPKGQILCVLHPEFDLEIAHACAAND